MQILGARREGQRGVKTVKHFPTDVSVKILRFLYNFAQNELQRYTAMKRIEKSNCGMVSINHKIPVVHVCVMNLLTRLHCACARVLL